MIREIISMKKIFPRIYVIFLFVLCFLSFFFISLNSVFAEEFQYSELFKKYKIPVGMRKPPMFYFLQRMEWQYKVAQSENWLEAMRLPAMPEKNPDYRNIFLDCNYDKKENKAEFYLSYLSFSRIGGNNLTLSNSIIDDIEADIEIDENNKIVKFLGSKWALLFHENDTPAEFIFITNMKFPELEERGGIEWDENGKEIYNPYAKIGKSFWEDVYCDNINEEKLKFKKTEINRISTFPPNGYTLHLPKLPIVSDVSKILKQIMDYDKKVRYGKIRPLLNVNGFENFRISNRYLKFYFHKDTLAQLWVYCLQNNNRLFGCYLDYDEKNRLLGYINGEMTENKSDKMKVNLPQCLIDGNGVEVKFHLTGYPASYKTIVKNSLLGHQIEWNENGEVISNVNLDTPKPWADAPKTPDETK
jgi:hypothetical protein